MATVDSSTNDVGSNDAQAEDGYIYICRSARSVDLGKLCATPQAPAATSSKYRETGFRKPTCGRHRANVTGARVVAAMKVPSQTMASALAKVMSRITVLERHQSCFEPGTGT